MQISKVMSRCFVSEPAKTEADHFGTQQIWASELQKFDQSSDLAVLSWSVVGGLPGPVLLVQSKSISKQTKRSETSTKEKKEIHTRSCFAKIRTMAQRNTSNMLLKLTGTWYCDHKFTCNLLRFAGILWMKFTTSKSMKKSRSKNSQFLL